MKPFHTIAVPHDDILSGRLTMEVFAADLWEVGQNRGADEYRDADTFFKKTYMTGGLQNILSVVEKRIRGRGGDPIIQIQTPFGGGKTHALIAMYHKAQEWGAKAVIVVGTALHPTDTLWGVLEKQLSGKIETCAGQVSPGKEIIRNLLSKHQPAIILMDEVLQYVTKAAGVKVGSSNLAAQSMAFMQELSEAVSTLEKVSLIVTLPASLLEHYDESAEKLYQQLQKVAGRMEKIYTPVEENEISKIIRRRLFSHIDLEAAKEITSEFVEYAEKENLLPANLKPSEYRQRFLDSYPFLPEVIDVLYHRWGSFHTFQRTRGVLRLLSLVICDLKESSQPYISLADFNLSNQELRQELLKHIGPEYNSIIASDITGNESGAKKVDVSVGGAYRGLHIGTRTATTIFMYSFSGGQEHGATLSEIKRSATTLQNPAPLVAEAVEKLKGKLFYLQSHAEKYFFSNQANLNRILLNNMDNVKESQLMELELELLRKSIRGSRFKTYIWEEKPSNIADSAELKLVALKKKDDTLINDILISKGQTPRVYRNTVFFLYPQESERSGFVNTLKRKIAFEHIASDRHLKLSEEQKKEIKGELKKLEPILQESIRRFYRKVAIPDKDGYKENDLGIPTYGMNTALDEELFEQLRRDGEVLEKMAPIVLKEKYLKNKDYVFTDQLYQSTLKTPGEARPSNRMILEDCIREGVRIGVFGLGEMEENKAKCVYFKENATISFAKNEIIIKEELCARQKKEVESSQPLQSAYGGEEQTTSAVNNGQAGVLTSTESVDHTAKQLHLRFNIPKGKVASIMGIVNLLQSKFNRLEISLKAGEGSISHREIEDKIEETFRQLNIDFEILNDD